MYTPFYNQLKTLINNGNLGINKIAWYNRQYANNFNDKQTPAAKSCFIQFSNVQWQKDGNAHEHGNTQIVFHLVTQSLKEHPQALMDFAEAFHNYMDEKSDTANQTHKIGKLTLSTSAEELNGQIHIMKLTYSCTLWRHTPNKYTTEVSAPFVIQRE